MKINTNIKTVFTMIAVLLSSCSLAGTYSGGNGTTLDPYIIMSAADINSLGSDPNDWSKCFKLAADVNMAEVSGTKYKIIGNATKKFTGTFDGNNFVIRNFNYATTEALTYVGFFGYTSYATISNVTLENVSISVDGQYVGSLIGYMYYGTTDYCHAEVNINATSASSTFKIGGLIGSQLSGMVSNCWCKGTMNASSSTQDSTSNSYVAGLVGYAARAENCRNEADVTVSTTRADAIAGGLTAYKTSGKLINCQNTGMVKAISSGGSAYVGGLVGMISVTSPSTCTITKCFSTGNVEAEIQGADGAHAGGLIGYSDDGTVNNCWASGKVIATDKHAGSYVSHAYAGGLIGRNIGGNIRNSYAAGDIISSSNVYYVYAGGLIGCHSSDNGSTTYMNCHSSGSVWANGGRTANAGGLCGSNGYGIFENCYSSSSANASTSIVWHSSYAGGLAGNMSGGKYINCYSIGYASAKVLSTGRPAYAGGLIGYQGSSAGSNMIQNCYSIGSAGADGNEIVYEGGLIGYSQAGTNTNCFWDTQTSSRGNAVGNITNPSWAFGMTTEEMKTLATFTSKGWDFVGENANGIRDIWRLCEDGDDYPRLTFDAGNFGDFACPDGIYSSDLAVFINAWLTTSESEDFKSICDISIPSDDKINIIDFAVFAENWGQN